MSKKNMLKLFSEYNQLMNQRIIKASSEMSESVLKEDRGAFFDSVIGTLNHIMVGDILWLKRFSSHPDNYHSLQSMHEIVMPSGLKQILFSDLKSFALQRYRLDATLINWCEELDEADLDKPLEYTNYKGEKHKKNLGALISHLFLHQVHHRGQITTLLSQQGIDFGETDLPEIIPEEK